MQLTAWDVLLKPQIILLVWFVAGLINRLAGLHHDPRQYPLWQTTTVYSSEEMQRRQLRISTTLNVPQRE